MRPNEQKLITELRNLSPELQARVIEFVLLLKQKGQEEDLRQCYARASEEAFAEIWDNDEDAIYDTI